LKMSFNAKRIKTSLSTCPDGSFYGSFEQWLGLNEFEWWQGSSTF